MAMLSEEQRKANLRLALILATSTLTPGCAGSARQVAGRVRPP